VLVSLVRHGDVIGRPFVFRGASDPPLSELGWQQLRARTAWLAHPAITRIVSSPAQRCRAFAEQLARDHGAPLAIDDDLRELAFGAWEDRTPEEVAASDGERLAAFRADPHSATPPGGEPYRELVSRVRAALARITHEGPAHLVVVTHAGVMRALVGDWLHVPAAQLGRIALGPASTCRVSLGEAPCLLSLDSGIACVD